jgi:hypothetical protein
MGSVFGPIRFLLPVCQLCWFFYTLNIYAHFSFCKATNESRKCVNITQTDACFERFLFRPNKMNCELMLTYDTPALWQRGSRNLTGQKTLPTIWGTYMNLVTKYQISAINSYWEQESFKTCICLCNIYTFPTFVCRFTKIKSWLDMILSGFSSINKLFIFVLRNTRIGAL